MPSARRSLSTSVGEFFAIDDDWERPAPPISRRDWTVGIVLSVVAILLLELGRSVTEIHAGGQPHWVQWVATVSGAMLMVWRRQRPILVGCLAAAHMFIVGVTMPMIMAQLALQTVYFVAIYAAVAYARHRRSALLIVAGITVFMLLWVGWQLALGGGIAEITEEARSEGAEGWFSPTVGAVATMLSINLVYFVGAILVGQINWRAARQNARLEEQASTITAQAEGLRRRAVVDERLRIARELHDVVGHHVAVIGIQAGAARRVMAKRPDEAAKALAQIEESSRDAVSQMRSLLGTLRDIQENVEPGTESGATSASSSSRSPEPTLSDLAHLVAERNTNGQPTAYELVESCDGAHTRIAAPIGLTLYRITQEALANITRHSTATNSDVVVRVVDNAPLGSYAEVEVLDNGHQRHGTSGTGMGQLGIRERAASHKGTVEMGPRPIGGYRVRVRIPLGESDVASV